MKRTRKNGPVITYKFKSPEMRDLYDRGKISFEEATYRVEPEPFMTPLITSQVVKIKTHLKNYVYPEAFNPDARRFLVINLKTGAAYTKRYFYTYQLLELVSDTARTHVFITNAEV